MPSAIGHGSQSEASAPSCMSDPYPDWARRSLDEFRERALGRGIVTVKLAAELADVRRMRLYRLRWSRAGAQFRSEWDSICAKGREVHRRRHR